MDIKKYFILRIVIAAKVDTIHTTTDIFYLVDYLLNNSFCSFGPLIFKQNISVPQGGNVSPLLADLTFTNVNYEYVYTKNYPYSDIYFFPYRYMDDLLILHNTTDDTILKLLTDVYRRVLSLEPTHISNYACNYLDLDISINNNIITTKMYNKTDFFGFPIKRFPHSSTNISIAIKRATIYTEVLRTARTCSNRDDFINRLKLTKNLLSTLGYDQFLLKALIYAVYTKTHSSYISLELIVKQKDLWNSCSENISLN